MPAPDSPVTSSCASSACAFFIVSCICCAWRIRFPNPPFIMPTSSSLVRGFHRSQVHVGAEALTQPLDRRIRFERSRGPNGLVLLLLQALSRRRGEGRLSRFEGQANVAAEIFRQAQQKFVFDGPRTPIRRRLIEFQRQHSVLERGRNTI